MSRTSDTPFRAGLTTSGAMAIIAVHGDLDLASRPECETVIERALASNPLVVAIDLRGLDFLDANGIGVLVDTAQRCGHDSRRFFLIRGSHQVQTALSAANVDSLFEIVDQPDQDNLDDDPPVGLRAARPTEPARRPRVRSA